MQPRNRSTTYETGLQPYERRVDRTVMSDTQVILAVVAMVQAIALEWLRRSRRP
jgi:hypothetical protein